MNTATMLNQQSGRTMTAISSGATQVCQPQLSVSTCLESLRLTVETLGERVAALERELDPVLPPEEPVSTAVPLPIPSNLPPRVAEILAIEVRVLELANRVLRLVEDVAI
jgi:hypothetical protein